MDKVSSFATYMFNIMPGSQFKFYIPMIAICLILLLGSLLFGFLYKNKKKEDLAFKHYFKKTANRLSLMGMLFLLLILVRYENIPYFSMRIWTYLSFLLLAYFIYKYLKTYFVDYTKERHNLHNKVFSPENKYLPNKHKR